MFQRVALDCLSYHATATDNDTNWLARESIPGPKDFNLYRWKMNFCSSWSYFFSFSATSSMIQSTMTVRLSRLLSECSSTLISSTSSLYLTKWVEYFLHTFQIFSVCQVVCRWALSVKKNYRPVKYHNWRHALNVCQTMFTMLKTGKVRKTKLNLTTPHLPTMQISFIICCLCLFSIYFEGISDKNGTHVSIFIMIIDGSIYGWPRGVWFTGGLSLSWSGPQGHQ